MAWPTTVRDDSYINKNSSGYAWAMQVLSGGAPLGTSPDVQTPDTIHPVGRIIGGKFGKTNTTSDEKDAGGASYSAETSTATTFEYQTAQRDKVTLDIPETMEGKHVRWIQELTTKTLGSNKIQYLIVADMTPDGTVEVPLTDVKPSHKWTCAAAGADIVLSLAITTGSHGAQTVSGTIAAGKYHLIVEMTKA